MAASSAVKFVFIMQGSVHFFDHTPTFKLCTHWTDKNINKAQTICFLKAFLDSQCLTNVLK